MPFFIDVEFLSGWRLFVVLSDGTTGVLDLSEWKTQPCCATLRDEREFARVAIDDHHALSWPGGPRLAAHEVYHRIRRDEGTPFSTC
ncbi:DUF2442 domain-containing protein [Aeromonas simiae]|uniref:DUF2442 domain-containing protein n=1 Tax=Aeromonas simiae TaxID=218936 RepID=UPI0005A6AA82|nr:DUF2442 domain-containing protein [Aeromonas simiae]MDO2948625.1 DUF2442 domain-containing protein [Aeromonas simiae]MDO2952055.1 DUF2442 domain-containing protein [Aeromonas simiae]MDO2956008.1 DUF2442 domain-containing protein [Aeromonas simiae]